LKCLQGVREGPPAGGISGYDMHDNELDIQATYLTINKEMNGDNAMKSNIGVNSGRALQEVFNPLVR
jgi:hypothetical protein